MTGLAQRARGIRLLVLDVDGVLTDGGLYFGTDGEAYKRFHVHDGAGIKAVQQAGIQVAIVSARSSAAVACRAAELRVAHVMQGETDKGDALQRLTQQLDVPHSAVAVVGDDLGDLPMLSAAGLGVAYHAKPVVKQTASHTISHFGLDSVLYLLGFTDSDIEQVLSDHSNPVED